MKTISISFILCLNPVWKIGQIWAAMVCEIQFKTVLLKLGKNPAPEINFPNRNNFGPTLHPIPNNNHLCIIMYRFKSLYNCNIPPIQKLKLHTVQYKY